LDEFIGGGIANIVVKFISRPSNGLAKDREAIAGVVNEESDCNRGGKDGGK